MVQMGTPLRDGWAMTLLDLQNPSPTQGSPSQDSPSQGRAPQGSPSQGSPSQGSLALSPVGHAVAVAAMVAFGVVGGAVILEMAGSTWQVFEGMVTALGESPRMLAR